MKELKKIENNEVIDYNNNMYSYHKERINRCLDWYFNNIKSSCQVVSDDMQTLRKQ